MLTFDKGKHWALDNFPAFLKYENNASLAERTHWNNSHGESNHKINVELSTKLANIEDIPSIRVPFIDCAQLFQGDSKEQRKADAYHKKHKRQIDSDFVKLASNCTHFRESQRFIMHPVSDEERHFPVAFSIIMYKDADMVAKLLRAIYRPQNYYCVHVDKKSPRHLHDNMAAIINCFSNVFIVSQTFDVRWGTYTTLEPELACMRDLWRYTEWRYFINLTGQMFPLKTNWDLVKILMAFNGSNAVSGYIKR